jgi:hypothetical protein
VGAVQEAWRDYCLYDKTLQEAETGKEKNIEPSSWQYQSTQDSSSRLTAAHKEVDNGDVKQLS